MNWSLSTLLGDVANAWSAENWPFTLAFWGAVALCAGAATYFERRRRKARGINGD